MGDRNEYIVNDERADTAMQRMLAQHAQPFRVDPPPDLVARTARRLPRVAPAQAAQAAARQRMLRVTLTSVLVLLVLFVALVGLFDVTGTGPQLASFFGNGSSGISEALLVARLLVKPLLSVFFTIVPLLLLASSVVAVIGGWLWWMLVRGTSATLRVEATQ